MSLRDANEEFIAMQKKIIAIQHLSWLLCDLGVMDIYIYSVDARDFIDRMGLT